MANSTQDLQNHHLRISGDDTTVTLTPAAGQTAVSVAADLSATGTLGSGAITSTGAVSGSSLAITSLLTITSDGTKATVLPATGDYLRVGDAGTTSHTLNANDDLLVSGKLEVDGAAFLDGALTVAGATGAAAVTATGQVSALNVVGATASDTALPVLKLTQTDVSEEFIRFIGESADTNSNSLADAADLPTPGAIVGWIKVYVEDVKSSGAITDGLYWIPFYATPTA